MSDINSEKLKTMIAINARIQKHRLIYEKYIRCINKFNIFVNRN